MNDMDMNPIQVIAKPYSLHSFSSNIPFLLKAVATLNGMINPETIKLRNKSAGKNIDEVFKKFLFDKTIFINIMLHSAPNMENKEITNPIAVCITSDIDSAYWYISLHEILTATDSLTIVVVETLMPSKKLKKINFISSLVSMSPLL